MAEVIIRPISAGETRPLRKAILRPQQTLEQLQFPGDEAADTLHVGAFRDGELVGIASVYHNPPPHRDDPFAWQLRGMAVVENTRRRGCGSMLLQACLAHASSHGGKTLWFNARTPAIPFYRAHGFETDGEEFELPGIGTHVLMRGRIGTRSDGVK